MFDGGDLKVVGISAHITMEGVIAKDGGRVASPSMQYRDDEVDVEAQSPAVANKTADQDTTLV